MILKTDVIVGILGFDLQEFDDYFEKHTDKFFTPELDKIFIYYLPGAVVGIQSVFRDPWGKYDKETYKGNL